MRRLYCLSALLLLTGCAASDAPVISFIGIAEGTLSSDLQQLQFSQTFTPDQRELVAVVGFDAVKEGTAVQATWFSPDDRQMPLGRSTVNIASGATIARFSFASRESWEKAPYLLLIDAFNPAEANPRTASGAYPFFIGMNEEEITEYIREYTAWKQAEAEQREEWEAEYARKKSILDAIQAELKYEQIGLLSEADVTGDGQMDFVVHEGPDAMTPGSPGAIVSGAVTHAAITDGSGAVLLSIASKGRNRTIESSGNTLTSDLPSDGEIGLSVLPSFTVLLTWVKDEQQCFAELSPSDTGYTLDNTGCR